jgi:histidine ammonia-lyase
MRTVIVDGDALTIADVVDVTGREAHAELGPGVPARMEASRRTMLAAISGGAPVYGVREF